MLSKFRMFRGLSVNLISGRVIMYIKLVVCWSAAFPFPSRNCLRLPLRISSGGGVGNLTRPTSCFYTTVFSSRESQVLSTCSLITATGAQGAPWEHEPIVSPPPCRAKIPIVPSSLQIVELPRIAPVPRSEVFPLPQLRDPLIIYLECCTAGF